MIAGKITLVGTALFGWALVLQDERGNRLYRRGETESAVAEYRGALEKRPDHPGIQYNLGTALLSTNRVAEAASYLTRALNAREPELRERAFYNLGNTHLAEGLAGDAEATRRAVEAYRQALLLRPGDVDAKWNLELALRQLERQEAERREDEPQGEGGEESPPAPEQGEGPPQGVAPPAAQATDPRGRPAEAPPLSRAAADQILNAVEEQERALQMEKLRRARPTARPAGPDW